MSQIGETDLSHLLATLTTTLHSESFIFTTLPNDTDLTGLPLSIIKACIFEPEGVTLIITAETAKSYALDGIYPCRMITLNVHSSLEAVGFMAAITTKLKDAGLSCNPISGYYHDHLFVPEDKAEQVVQLLEDMAEEARRDVPGEQT